MASAVRMDGIERGRRSPDVWLCLATSAVVFWGFSVTYFGPLSRGEYPAVSPAVHIHGWSFFLWYVLLPVQAGLVALRKVSTHRRFGLLSLGLASVMVASGLVVVGTQMELASGPDGSPFWQFLGPTIFVTLLLFVVFYGLAIHFRRRRELHRRFILLASTGALGAAAFRVLASLIGFGSQAGVIGILAPNVIIVAAMVLERVRGERVHPVFAVGLLASVVAEGGMILLTPGPVGRAVAAMLAFCGRQLAVLY